MIFGDFFSQGGINVLNSQQSNSNDNNLLLVNRMARVQFDNLDCKILKMLSKNARKPYLEVARECNVSGAAVHQRIQKLTSLGVIQGFETLIAPSALGYDTCAYIGIFLSDPSAFDAVMEGVKNIPEVVECHCTTGKYDLLLKLYAQNNNDLLRIIREKLQIISSARTETIISFKEEFKRQVPIDQDIL